MAENRSSQNMNETNRSIFAENETSQADKSAGSTSNQKDETATAAPTEYIVVAEDSPPNRMIIVHLLTKLGFGVVECQNGEMAWNEISQNQNRNVVAVFTDIMMPKLDGMELLARIRNSERHSKTPVVLITAVSDKDYIINSKKLGVNGYILKPVTFERVLAKLKELFPERKFLDLRKVG